MVLQKDKLFTMNVSDCILKGFKFPWREIVERGREWERERDREKER